MLEVAEQAQSRFTNWPKDLLSLLGKIGVSLLRSPSLPLNGRAFSQN